MIEIKTKNIYVTLDKKTFDTIELAIINAEIINNEKLRDGISEIDIGFGKSEKIIFNHFVFNHRAEVRRVLNAYYKRKFDLSDWVDKIISECVE